MTSIDFNPRPREGGDVSRSITPPPDPNFNPRPPRGGRRRSSPFPLSEFIISIHAPREGGDPRTPAPPAAKRYFNPRPPRGGRPPFCSNTQPFCPHFNPRPREGGDGSLDVIGNKAVISIHAPREGGDVLPKDKADEIALFQSTPPARGATAGHHLTVAAQVISIHAPREGGVD